MLVVFPLCFTTFQFECFQDVQYLKSYVTSLVKLGDGLWLIEFTAKEMIGTQIGAMANSIDLQMIALTCLDMVPWKKLLSQALFPKQFTVGVLNATWDLAALVLVGVVGFLGSEVVLSPVVSHCLRLWGVGVGWCGRLLGLWSGLVSRCLRLSPFMWGAGGGWCSRI